MLTKVSLPVDKVSTSLVATLVHVASLKPHVPLWLLVVDARSPIPCYFILYALVNCHPSMVER